MKNLKQLFLVTAILFFSVKANAQGWEIGIDNGVLLSSTTYKVEGITGNPDLGVSAAFGLSTGLQVSKRISQKLRLKTGLVYYRNAVVFKDFDYVTFGGSWLGKANAYEHINYFGVPLQVQGFFSSSKASFGLTGGVGLNFLSKAQSKIVFANQPPAAIGLGKEIIEDISDRYNNFNLSFIMGPSFRYKFNNRLILNADLLINVGLLNVAKTDNYSQKITSYGAFVGISYPLGK